MLNNENLNKYSSTTLSNWNQENAKQIIKFLYNNKCDYIDEILEDYFDIVTIDYIDFIGRFEKLNKKYNDKFLELARYDMNYLEELFI